LESQGRIRGSRQGLERRMMTWSARHGGDRRAMVFEDLACSTNETSQGECKLMSKLDYESTSELSLWFVCALWRLACRMAGVPDRLARLSDSWVLCALTLDP